MPETNQDHSQSSSVAGEEAQIAPTTRSPDASSRRALERDAVSYLGIASYGDSVRLQVELLDLSAQGARMVVTEAFEPPSEFVLKIPETGACFLADVIWQEGSTIGVHFISPLVE